MEANHGLSLTLIKAKPTHFNFYEKRYELVMSEKYLLLKNSWDFCIWNQATNFAFQTRKHKELSRNTSTV